MNSNRNLTIFLFRILPKSLISRIFGWLTRIPLPSSIMRSLISWYTAKFGIDMNEYEIPSGGFRTFDCFFTRLLKEGMRPVDTDPRAIVSPVDARLDQFGPIKGDTIIQAKGMDFSLRDLVPSDSFRDFQNGSFMTLYLSPGDYHRIHAPAGGEITGYFHIPGKLYTVQEFMVQGLRRLFCINERVISFIKTGKGHIAVCKVGAMNVGRISLSYADVISNRSFRSRKEVHFTGQGRPAIKAGEELGIFHLGSTVILLFEKNMITFANLTAGQSVRLGQRIGTFIS